MEKVHNVINRIITIVQDKLMEERNLYNAGGFTAS